jgi:hypothetical protein
MMLTVETARLLAMPAQTSHRYQRSAPGSVECVVAVVEVVLLRRRQ